MEEARLSICLIDLGFLYTGEAMVFSRSKRVFVEGWNLTSVFGECLPKNF